MRYSELKKVAKALNASGWTKIPGQPNYAKIDSAGQEIRYQTISVRPLLKKLEVERYASMIKAGMLYETA